MLATLTIFASCRYTDSAEPEALDDRFKMKATVTSVGEHIEVTVTESEYTSGIHWVLTADQTEYLDQNGARISRADILPGASVEISYSGQVMMSYPPQIVAARIRIL